MPVLMVPFDVVQISESGVADGPLLATMVLYEFAPLDGGRKPTGRDRIVTPVPMLLVLLKTMSRITSPEGRRLAAFTCTVPPTALNADATG